MTDKTDLEKNLDSAIEKVGNDMYSFVSKPLLIECRDVLIENQSLTSRIEGLEEIAKAVAHVGIDIGYGVYELEPETVDKARKYFEINHSTGGGDNG
ncbi:MAG: hypothetical protein RJS98_04075 [Rhodospirillaceae bacterium]